MFDVYDSFLDITEEILDNHEPLMGHSLSWDISKPPNQTGENRFTAKVWVPEIPTESDLININSYSNDFHQYLWLTFPSCLTRTHESLFRRASKRISMHNKSLPKYPDGTASFEPKKAVRCRIGNESARMCDIYTRILH